MLYTSYNIVISYDLNSQYYIASMPEVPIVATGASQGAALNNLLAIASTASQPVELPYVLIDKSGTTTLNGVTYSPSPLVTMTYVNNGMTYSAVTPLNPNFI